LLHLHFNLRRITLEKKNLTTQVLIVLIAFVIACNSKDTVNIENKNLAKLVNPFIGTGGHGHTYPGASTPFGFVQLSPDSRLEGWDGCGGYHYSDSIIYGFTHTHLSGTGVSDYGDILLMPMDHIAFDNGYGLAADSGYGSSFSHQEEHAEAGYYQTKLLDYNIKVELTATSLCGFHHYEFLDDNTPNYVLLDLQHRDQLIDSELEIIDNRIIQGKRISKAWAREQHVYFHMAFNQDILNYKFNKDSTKIALQFEDNHLLIKTGLSAVSKQGAKKNLEAEIPHWEFEKTKQETQDLWNKELGKIQIEMPHDSDEVIFYTALYHSYLNPNLFEDVNGDFRGTDLKVHNHQGSFTNYTIFSLWDTYRATHPLFTITQQERTKDFLKTFLSHYQTGGKLPVWELAGNYTGCMIGYHSVPIIVDAYVKGIDDFDQRLALEAMVSTAKADELGKKVYAANGYAAKDEEHESVSKTLEYAYDDWCIAQFAKTLGEEAIYKEFMQRAQHYKNIFDPNQKFMRSKRNQQFSYPFDPKEVNFNFTEANSWQYSFYVPQDIDGLIELHGGKEAFEHKLDSLFTVSNQTSGRHQVDITGLVGQYAHGNEPSHHMAYLYNYIDKPSKTQKMVSYLLKEMYSQQADGLIGNEDCGQMSSWYVLSALGFYPVTPGSENYIIGSPLAKAARINLENGNTFSIEVKHTGSENLYIQKVHLNDKEYHKSYLTHQSIMEGGILSFEMGDQENDKWFTQNARSAIEDHIISPVPYIKNKNQIFKDSIQIILAHPMENASIFYSIDKRDFQNYIEPINLNKSANIRIKAKLPEASAESPVVEANFYQLDQKRKVIYKQQYNPQYAAGGETGLIDNIRGGSDFRTGSWQGFQGEDIEIIVELEGVEEISHINSGYIQDINSWIWMPTEVAYSISVDGINYTQLKILKNKLVPTDQYGVFLHEFDLDFEPRQCKFVKLNAKQFGTIPDWHLGKGGESFIFIDEIMIH